MDLMETVTVLLSLPAQEEEFLEVEIMLVVAVAAAALVEMVVVAAGQAPDQMDNNQQVQLPQAAALHLPEEMGTMAAAVAEVAL